MSSYSVLVKQYFLGLMRRRSMQPVWQLLSHLSAMGLNHWATHLSFSGELSALKKLSLIIPPGTVAFDVGANHGDYSLAVLEILRPQKIYAFEPSSAAFEILRSKVDENVVKPIRIGVGSEPGKATLHNSTPGASIGSMLDLRSPFAPFDPTFDETVEVTTVDFGALLHETRDFHFAQGPGDGLEFAGPELGRNLVEQVVDLRRADGLEHGGDIGLSVWYERHGLNPNKFSEPPRR